VIVPIYRTDEEQTRVLEAAAKIAASLGGLRVRVDDREEQRPGFKFNEWELRGVPARLEVGPRDLDAEQITVARRDTGGKESVPFGVLGERLHVLLDEIQRGLYEQAVEFRERHTFRPKDYAEMAQLLDDPGGFMIAPWCGSPECEAKVKSDTKATIRFLPLEPGGDFGRCIVCGERATEEAAWAEAY
jgi:prolyl-tRNA synthetase